MAMISTSTQCNTLFREKASKSVQVTCCVRSKGVACKLLSDEIDLKSTKRDKSTQCEIDCEDKATQIFNDVLPLAIEKVLYVLTTVPEFYDLRYQIEQVQGDYWLHVTSQATILKADSLPFYPTNLWLSADGILRLSVFMKPVVSYNLWTDNGFDMNYIMNLLRVLSAPATVCEGIALTNDNRGTLNQASYVHCTWPYEHVRSKHCSVTYSTAIATKRERKLCLFCESTNTSLRRKRKRNIDLSPNTRFKRMRVNSKCNLQFLTPTSKRVRLQRIRTTRKELRKKVRYLMQKLEKHTVFLDDSQSQEMCEIVRTISDKFSNEADTALSEVSDNATAEAMKRIWKQSVDSCHISDVKDFQHDQRSNKASSKSNRWHTVTLRMALAVYSRSPAAYRALCNFNILKLPSVWTLKNNCKQYNEQPGVNHAYLDEQRTRFNALRKETSNKGQPGPTGDGVLIFDEVKVLDKIAWNSKNHKFVGIAMDESELPSVRDIGDSLASETPVAAQYILQCVWRDLGYDFDVIGPYFTSSKSLHQSYLIACLFEMMRAFFEYGFSVMCLVCDGASVNLNVIKALLGITGSFGNRVVSDVPDYSIQPSFNNPFENGRLCHIIVCPSYEMKNLISALHSSRPLGTKNFCRSNTSFGWLQIIDMKSREDERFACGQSRFIRRLQQSYIDRDSWTRLNVKPSKIMQQEEVLCELFDHASKEMDDKDATKLTYQYLKACNDIFENGFFSTTPVRSIDSPVVESILRGFKFFSEWCAETEANAVVQASEVASTSSKEAKVTRIVDKKAFLAWQTWDLLRLCVYGVQNLVRDFTSTHPNNFLVLSRINGSVVEGLFSQLKFAVSGKLSSINYSWARRAVMVKANVHSNNSNNIYYRDEHLAIAE